MAVDMPAGTLTVHAIGIENQPAPALLQNVACGGQLLTVEQREPVFLLELDFHELP